MPGLSRRRRLLVLATCCASILVVVMDISIVNVALPAMRRDLRASVSGLERTADAYTLVLASVLILAGSTADRVGRRRVFMAGLAASGLGSLLCGLAPGIGWLIAARTLQAAGGTMLNPVAMAITAGTLPAPAEPARAIGVLGSVSGLAPADPEAACGGHWSPIGPSSTFRPVLYPRGRRAGARVTGAPLRGPRSPGGDEERLGAHADRALEVREH